MKKILSIIVLVFWAVLSLAQNSTNPNGYNVFYYPNGQKKVESYLGEKAEG